MLDPHTFWAEPYLACPRCGRESFGEPHFTVGVKECWACRYKEVIKLPALRKRVIYLHQGAMSDMMEALNPKNEAHERARAHPLWPALYERLDRLTQLQLAICPMSEEHRRESLVSPFPEDLDKITDQLSQGISFNSFNQIWAGQVFTAAKAWVQNAPPTFDFDPAGITSKDLHAWSPRLRLTVRMNLAAFADRTRRQRDAAYAMFTPVYESRQQDPRSFDELLEIEGSRYGPALLRIEQGARQRQAEMWARALAGEPDTTEPEDWMTPPAVSVVEGLRELFVENNLPPDDSLTGFFQSRLFRAIPQHQIDARIWAAIGAQLGRGQRAIPNQGAGVDVFTISTLFPYCDAIFVDNGARAWLEQVPQGRRFPCTTQVFSANTGVEFLKYLTAIEDSAPAEHVQMVRQVYGEDWPRPFNPFT